MARYLIDVKGIPADSVLKERESRDTIENFAFAKKLIQARERETHPERNYETDPIRVLVVTSDSHLRRSLFLARRAGFVSPEGLAAPTPPLYVPMNFLREVASWWKLSLRTILAKFAF